MFECTDHGDGSIELAQGLLNTFLQVHPSPQHPHREAGRPTHQDCREREGTRTLRPRDAGPTSPGPLYIRYCCLHSYFHLSDATAIHIYMK